MSASVERFEQNGLSIVVSKSDRETAIRWHGVSDARDPGKFLHPIVNQLTSELAGTNVTVDFSCLEYMNSATVAPIINFVKGLDSNGASVLVLFADADWQRTHLRCMKAISRTLTHVRVEGKPTK